MEVTAFIHVGTVGRYQSIFDELVMRLLNAPVGQTLSCIHVACAGSGSLRLPCSERIRFLGPQGPLDEAEFATLKHVEQFAATHPEAAVLYMHTKGASHSGRSARKADSWRRYMEHFCIDRADACIAALAHCDACGVDLSPWPASHFSGNFWWATCRYLRTLPAIQDVSDVHYPHLISRRHTAELWIGMNREARLFSHFDLQLNGLIRHKVMIPGWSYRGRATPHPLFTVRYKTSAAYLLGCNGMRVALGGYRRRITAALGWGGKQPA